MRKDSKDRDLVNNLLLMLLIFTLIPNIVQFWNYKSYKRFDWKGSVISSKGNIVQVSDCTFKGNYYSINKDMILDDGWKEINSPDNYMKNTFFPDSLSLTWFSYKEEKFYSGSFALPNELIEEKAIQMGIENDYKWDRILQFIAEIQPKGKVMVWIHKDSQENEQKIKIGMFQAKEVKATWHIFDDQIQQDSTSYINIAKKVALVMEQHTYTINVKLPEGYSLGNSRLGLFNQNNWYFNAKNIQNEVCCNFLPKDLILYWGNGKRNFTTQITFYEDDVLDFFRKECSNKNPLILELVVNNRNNNLKATLKSSESSSQIILKDKYPAQFGGDIIELK